MRYIKTTNSQIEFVEATADDKILSSIGLQLGEVYFQIKNKKVTFYLNDSERPFDNYIWSIDIPFVLDDVEYATEEDASAALSALMVDGIQGQLDELKDEVDEVKDEQTTFEQKLDDEIARSTDADERLNDKLDDEIARSISADTQINDKVDAEIARSTSADTQLNNKIDQEIVNRVADVDAEEARATAKENEIEDALNDEVTRSTAKDAEHDALLSGLTNSINNEITRALAAEEDLDDKIDAEITRANAEETRIEGLINDEITRSTAKDASQDALISGLTTSLQTEINRAQGAENSLRNDLNNEVSARTSADNAMLQRITTLEAEKANKSDVYTKAESDDKYATQDYVDGKFSNSYTKPETDALIANFYDGAEYDSSTKRINFKHGEIIKTYIDATDFIKDGMVETAAVVGDSLVISFNTDAGKEAISIPLSDIFDPNNYYTKDEVDASQTVQNTKINALSGDVQTISGDVQSISGNVTTISGDVQTISGDVQVLDGKIDTLSGNIVTLSGEIQTLYSETVTISGSVNTLSGEVQTIQSEIDDIDLSDYYNKTEVDGLLDEKLDASAYTPTDLSNYYTKPEVDASQSAQDTKITALSGKVETLSGDAATKEYVSAFTYDKATIDEKVSESGHFDPTQYYNKAATDALLDEKLDASAYTPTDLSNYYTKSEVDASQSVQDTKINEISGKTDGVVEKINTLSGEVVTIKEEVDDIDLTNYYTKSESDNKYQLKGDYVTDVQLSAFTYDKETIDEKVAEGGHFDPTQYYNKTATDALLDEKLDASAYTPTDLSNYYTKSEVDTSQGAQDAKINEISGKTDGVVEKVNTLSGEVQTIQSEIDDIDLSNYYTKSESDGKYQLKGDYVTGAQLSAFTYDKATIDEKVSESGHFDPTQYYNKTATDALLDEKLDVTAYTPTDLSDYWTSAQTQSAINQATSGKQDTLTAGSGISIVNNVISATGGSSPIDAYTKAESDAKFATITNFNSHSGNTNMHVTAAEKSTWNNKSDFSGNYNDLTNKPTIPSYSAGDGISISNQNVISTVTKFWCGTQAQYDAIIIKDPYTVYMIHE